MRVVNLTGVAAESVGGFEKKRRTRTAKKKHGGEEELPVLNGPIAVKKIQPPVLTPIVAPVVAPVPVVAPTPTPAPVEMGGAIKQIKVELKKKIQTRKVHLQPKKAEVKKIVKNVTKKARKVMLGVSSMHRRMTRAKKMHKKAKDMPLDKLREELLKKKLIKPTSKAPESVLRQIAADSQIVAGKAL